MYCSQKQGRVVINIRSPTEIVGGEVSPQNFLPCPVLSAKIGQRRYLFGPNDHEVGRRRRLKAQRSGPFAPNRGILEQLPALAGQHRFLVWGQIMTKNLDYEDLARLLAPRLIVEFFCLTTTRVHTPSSLDSRTTIDENHQGFIDNFICFA
jgi:hypothetical protein